MGFDDFSPNKCTEKEMPALSMLFDCLMSSDFSASSEQIQKLIEENNETLSKATEFYRSLSPKQRDIIDRNDEVKSKMQYMELSEKFCAGFKLGAMLMKEIFDKTHD